MTTNVYLTPTFRPVKPVALSSVLPQLSFALDFSGAGSVSATFSAAAPVAAPVSADMDALYAKVDLANNYVLSGVTFDVGGERHVMKASGDLQKALSPTTGSGTKVGEVLPSLGSLTLTQWTPGAAPTLDNWRGVAGAPVGGLETPFVSLGVTFRIATAPVRVGSFSLLGTLQDGTNFNVVSDASGYISTTRIKGVVNYNTGVVTVFAVTPTAPVGTPKLDLSFLGIPGVDEVYIDLLREDSLRYNATSYTYLPMDADLIGVEGVRLPTDGRAPIYRKGEAVVVWHAKESDEFTATTGMVFDCARTRLSRVRVRDADGQVLHTGYTIDLDAGTVLFGDVSSWAQPVTVEDRIEDMRVMRDVQITGELTFTTPLSHAYPLGSYVSSALMLGSLRARVSLVFDQQTWNGTTWSDVVEGDAAVATFDDTAAPIVVTNAGAANMRWAIHFQTNTIFRVVGEHVGVIATGSTGEDCAPVNPVTGQPYFFLPALGWGSAWAAGNVLRFNTVAAQRGVWVVRTTQQGPETYVDDDFELLIRGDVNRP